MMAAYTTTGFLCLAGSGGARTQSQGQNYILTRTYLNEDGRATFTFTDL